MKTLLRPFMLFVLLFSFFKPDVYGQEKRIVEYDLVVHDTIVSFTGKKTKALAINGQIPGPMLRFVEGDSAVIRLHNKTDEETTIHWHGLIVPVEHDGVPFLTTAPTYPGESHVYTFPIVQNGTYFYHSHSGLQHQLGVYGPLVIEKREDDLTLRDEDKLPEHTLLLSDWTDVNPHEVMRLLMTGSDWGNIKKGSTQSYWEALRAGHLGTKFVNEWKRMSSMDISDVYYDKFLVNGKEDILFPDYRAGEKVRLRIINGSASTNFWIQYSGGKMEVIASDGKDVVPVQVDRILIAVAETFDIVVTVPENRRSFELSATAEDRTGFVRVWLGEGEKHFLAPLQSLKYFEGMKSMNSMMDMSGNMKPMDMSLKQIDSYENMYPEIKTPKVHHHNDHDAHKEPQIESIVRGEENSNIEPDESVTLNYSMLRSTIKTTLPDNAVWRELRFTLTGNMERYVWTIDDKTISESDKILIKGGENIRIILFNNSMMRHPMHLHGHFFRVINQHSEYAPLKNVIDVMPMETDTIEFHASEENGDWFFHCHILYHMMSGMGKIFEYENSNINSQLPDKEAALKQVYAADKMFYLTAKNEFLFNGNVGKLNYENTRWAILGEWKLGYERKYGWEANLKVGRYLDRMQWLMPYVGVEWSYMKGGYELNMFGQWKTNKRIYAVAGIRYMLPWFILADAGVNMYGKARLQLERENLALTSRLRMDLMANTDKEYRVALHYLITQHIALTGSWSNEMKWGAGIKIVY